MTARAILPFSGVLAEPNEISNAGLMAGSAWMVFHVVLLTPAACLNHLAASSP